MENVWKKLREEKNKHRRKTLIHWTTFVIASTMETLGVDDLTDEQAKELSEATDIDQLFEELEL